MDKLKTIDEAIDLIKDGDTVAVSGFMMATAAREILVALGKRYKTTSTPKGLTLYQGAGNGNNNDQGVCEMSYPGLIKRYVTAHFANNRPMIEMALKNEVEAYNFPQGVIAHIYRQAAARRSFEISKIGLNTYCDPRQRGGKINQAAKEDLVELIKIDDEEYLKYKVPKFDIAIIRCIT